MTTDFYSTVPSITLSDPLAELLGAADGGIFTYTYADAVKLAGHSCPTVAGAYLMLLEGLSALYGTQTPLRGGIRVTVRGRLGEGTVGVIANVASLVTGAAAEGGFHGLAGQFDRRDLLHFDAALDADMALTRVDNAKSVLVHYNPSSLPADPRIGSLFPMIASGRADAATRQLFAQLWQTRVKTILTGYRNHPQLIRLT